MISRGEHEEGFRRGRKEDGEENSITRLEGDQRVNVRKREGCEESKCVMLSGGS